MNITSAKFVKGVTHADPLLENGIPQIAFIGRSNVGKSSVINSLAHEDGLAKTSSFPGRTQQINLFLLNKAFYLVDLPGYGFADISEEGRDRLQKLIDWYLFVSDYQQKKVVFIIDAKVGLTMNDFEMLHALEDHEKDVVIVANKIDKINKSEYQKQSQTIKDSVGGHKVIFYSAIKGAGVGELTTEVLKAVTVKKAVRKVTILGGSAPMKPRGIGSKKKMRHRKKK